jgi:hypothetical protein
MTLFFDDSLERKRDRVTTFVIQHPGNLIAIKGLRLANEDAHLAGLGVNDRNRFNPVFIVKLCNLALIAG